MEQLDIVIIGAGAVGLAVAAEIARKDREIYILEKETTHGQGTSSRNSEVIHAGIYYPKGSLKAELCVEANPMIYETCEKHNIPPQPNRQDHHRKRRGGDQTARGDHRQS